MLCYTEQQYISDMDELLVDHDPLAPAVKNMLEVASKQLQNESKLNKFADGLYSFAVEQHLKGTRTTLYTKWDEMMNDFTEGNNCLTWSINP